jgi:endoglucanase
MHKNTTFSIVFLLSVLCCQAQLNEPAFQMNERLGRGINMGNCFEAPSETAWGNPWKPEYFRIMSVLGFRHVRIPIRWEPADRSDSVTPYTIRSSFLNRIKQVVDTALKYKLHVIINMHHHDSLFANPEGQKARFLAQWQQIAQFFRSYPDSLLFEVLNEPNNNLTASKWNMFFADALAEIRKTNPTRYVLMGVAEWGGLSALSSLQFPNDENIILTIHYYNPFHFTHQGAEWAGDEAQSWLGTKWNDTETERQTVRNEFKYAIQLSKDHHIPIHIGEFGAYSKADEASRVRWTTYLGRWFEEQGFSWAYWEFSAGFGIYSPSTKQLLTPLVNALLHNLMPQPTPIEASPVYTSNFTTNNDGWSLNFQQGAATSWTRSGGKLNITISNAGSENWHVQLVRNGIPLVKGKMYRVSFTAKATATRPAVAYTGKSADPWNAYSDYNSFQFSADEETLSYTFTMNSTSDNNSRIVFDLGKSAIAFTMSDIRMEEIRIMTQSTSNRQASLRFYPNPFNNEITIENYSGLTKAEIILLTGSVIQFNRLAPGSNHIKTGQLPAGVYLLMLAGDRESESYTIIKR